MNIARFLATMAGRLFVLLLIGIIASAALALTLSEREREAEISRIRYDRTGERMADFLAIVDRAPRGLRAELISAGVTGVRRATGREALHGPDADLTQGLSARWRMPVRAIHADPHSCLAPSPADHDTHAADHFDCWVVAVQLSDGAIARLQLRSRVPAEGLGLNPTVVLILAALMVSLALVAARMAAAPLDDLARAATELGNDLDRRPLPETGPVEVRDAAKAFNQMQTRLRASVVERTQLLASITHDLQTPMTRLRLRLEKVGDAALRSRLIDDLGVMQALIREGLDYARNTQSTEPLARLDLDHLLELVVEDAAVGGKPVRFIGGCGAEAEVRARALQRCLANLIDNAVKYGGATEVSAQLAGDDVDIRIRDRGPGIPADKLAHVFEPFVRVASEATSAIDGIGLGLAIARTLAERNGASLTLRNHPEGGLEARLILKATGAAATEELTDPA
jgi:signal transduction histidine kinase